jgi:hypothetical protein
MEGASSPGDEDIDWALAKALIKQGNDPGYDFRISFFPASTVYHRSGRSNIIASRLCSFFYSSEPRKIVNLNRKFDSSLIAVHPRLERREWESEIIQPMLQGLPESRLISHAP